MLKALRWSAGGQESPSVREVPEERPSEAAPAPVRELRTLERLSPPAPRPSVTVEDALREMENAMAVQRELRASAGRLLAKLAT